MALQSFYIKPYMGFATSTLANTYRNLGKYSEARKYYGISIRQAEYFNNSYLKARVYINLIDYFIIKKDPDSAIYFGKLALQVSKENHFSDYASRVSKVLSNFYESLHQPDSAPKYLKIRVAATDTIFSGAKMQEFQKLIYQNDQKQKEAVAAKERFQDKVRLYASLAGVGIFL